MIASRVSAQDSSTVAFTNHVLMHRRWAHVLVMSSLTLTCQNAACFAVSNLLDSQLL